MTLAFLAYGIGSISLFRFKVVGSIVLIFLTMGAIFDFSAIVLMIRGSRGTPFSFHGFIGYLAFLFMLIELASVWRIYFKGGIDVQVGKGLMRYTKFAYFFWVMAYFTGSLIIIWR